MRSEVLGRWIDALSHGHLVRAETSLLFPVLLLGVHAYPHQLRVWGSAADNSPGVHVEL